MQLLAFAAAALWLAVMVLPWRPWSTRERIAPLDADDGAGEAATGVTALVPARNEAGTIASALASLVTQPGVSGVVVVDDQSEDDTGAIAASMAGAMTASKGASMPEIRVVPGRPAPAGWSGKLWAQQQGLAGIESRLVLLIDADIRLAPGMVPALVRKLEREQLDQVSVMASLPASSLPEKLMLPAFVYFFKQIYPFAWVNRPDRPFAAAAGGCVLVRRECLEKTGAFEAWKNTLIDDCELAARIRAAGGRIWLGLSHGVVSMRRHPDFASILETVSRTAYTQLGHSLPLLLLVVGLMLVAFATPPAALVTGLLMTDPVVALAGLAGWLVMALSFLPQVRFAGLGAQWSLALPLAAMLFLVATIDSAIRHHFGAGPGWKGRRYEG